MNTATRVGAYVADLAVVFGGAVGGAVGGGNAVGPVGPPGNQPQPTMGTEVGHDDTDADREPGSHTNR